MRRFWLCLPIFFSLVTTGHAEDFPVSADNFLHSIEPDPSVEMLYNYFDIYGAKFALCRENGAQIRALGYMAKGGAIAYAKKHVEQLGYCGNLTPEETEQLKQLAQNLSVTLPQPSPAVPEEPPALQVRRTHRGSGFFEMHGETVQKPTLPTGENLPIGENLPVPENQPMAGGINAPLGASTSNNTAMPDTLTAETANIGAESPVTAILDPAKPLAPEAPLSSVNTDQAQANDSERVTLPASASELEAKAKPAHQAVRRAAPVPRPLVKTALSVNTPQLPPPPSRSSRAQASRGAGEEVGNETGEQTPVGVDKAVKDKTIANNHFGFGNLATYRSGDKGTSRLLRLENTASMRHKEVTVGVVTTYLNSFSPSNSIETGSAPNGQEARQSLKTEDTVWAPQAEWARDDLSVTLGTTPLAGTVSPLPTFNLTYEGDNLLVQAFQEPVKDSLLSYVGFSDIYSGDDMGRVLKSGAKIGWQDTFAQNWFYGGAVTGSYFYGENTKENTAVKGELYGGRSFGDFAVGLYGSYDHFKRDLNHFTYGHGGYYSPFNASTIAAFTSWQVKKDDDWFKADVSVGYLYEETKDSRRYFRGGGEGADYEGETNEQITINTGIEGGVYITETVSLTGMARFLNSGAFNEIKGGVSLGVDF